MNYFFLIISSFLFQTASFSQTEVDKKEIIKLCIDLEEFQQYYNLSKGGRLPVVVLENGVVPVIEGLEKFEKPIEFWSIEKIFDTNKAHLSFSTFEVTATKARAIFSYEAEGVHVIMSFAKKEGSWRVLRSSVTER